MKPFTDPRAGEWRGTFAFALLLLLALCAPQVAFARTQVDSFSFVKEKHADIVGEGRTLLPDGKPDANFFLSLRGVGIISQIQLKNLTNGQMWDTNADAGHRVLLAQSRSGEILNTPSSVKKLIFLFGIRLSLWVNDQEAILAKDAEYEVTVHFTGGNTVKAKTKIAAQPPSRREVTDAPSAEIVSALFLGQGSLDIVGPGPNIKPNGVKDWIVAAHVRAHEMITGFRLTNAAGSPGEWDTLPESPAPTLAVTSTNLKLLSFPDGSVRIPVKGARTFYLWVENNGTLGKTGTRSKLVATLADGRIIERAVMSSGSSQSVAQVVSADYRGVSGYDFVGSRKSPGSNLNADLCFDLRIHGEGILVNVVIHDLDNKNMWDADASSSSWLVGVSKAGSRLLNNEDGGLSLSLKGETQLFLWVEPKNTDHKSNRYRITLTWEDGRITEVETF